MSADYIQNRPELVRDGSDGNQHEYRQACVRKKLTYQFTSLKRLSR